MDSCLLPPRQLRGEACQARARVGQVLVVLEGFVINRAVAAFECQAVNQVIPNDVGLMM